MIADAAGLVLVNICFLVAGLGVTAAVGWWSGRPRALTLGLAYLAGVASYGVLAQLLLVLGASLSRGQVVGVCAVLAAGLALRRRGHGSGRVAVSTRWALPIAAILVLLAVDLWFQPLWAYDSWTFWTPKARALAALGGLDVAWFTSADLLNRDYPVLLPAIEAAGFRFTGYEERLLDLQSWLFLVAFAAAFWEVVRPRSRGWVAWVVLATMLIAPSTVEQLAAAEADLPLAAFFACAGLCAYLWLEERAHAALALFAVFAAASVATKAEGTLFVLALTVVAAGIAARTSWASAGAIAAASAAAFAVGLGPWRLWVAAHDVPPSQTSLGRVFDVGFLADHVDRVPYAAAYLAARVVDPRAWLLLVPLCVAATIAAFRAGAVEKAAFATGVVALSLLGLLLAYWTTPLALHYHLATSARRVITPPLLFWASVTPMLVAAAHRDKDSDGAGYPLTS